MSGGPIRQLGNDDLAHFKAIRLEALKREPDPFASTVADWIKLSDAEWLRRMTDNPVFVAFRGGVPVGIMGLMREMSSKCRHRATLIMVYLRAGERGGGLAAGLLGAVMDYARRNDIAPLELRVNAENSRAIAFYERQGFRAVGTIPDAVRSQGGSTAELLMVRQLSNSSGLEVDRKPS